MQRNKKGKRLLKIGYSAITLGTILSLTSLVPTKNICSPSKELNKPKNVTKSIDKIIPASDVFESKAGNVYGSVECLSDDSDPSGIILYGNPSDMISGTDLSLRSEINIDNNQYYVTVLNLERQPTDDASYPIYGSLDLSNDTHLYALADFTFMFANITSVCLPNSIKDIGASAFFECTNLANVQFNCPLLDSIWWAAFAGCSELTEVDLSQCINLMSIGVETFLGCTNLTQISIPSTVSYIGEDCFAMCENLDTVFFNPPSPPSSIYDNCFACATNLSKFVINCQPTLTDYSNYLIEIKRYGVNIEKAKVYEKISSANGIINGDNINGYVLALRNTSSNKFAISDGSNLTFNTLSFSDQVNTIDNNAFDGIIKWPCNITIPDSITTIGEKAFNGNYINYLYLNWAYGPLNKTCGANCFAPSSDANFRLCIPLGTASYYDDNFWQNVGVSTNQVNEYTDNANYVFCNDPTASGNFLIKQGSNLNSNDSLFEANNVSGKNLEFQSNITNICANALANNSKILGKLTIPTTVNSIESYAFSGCDGITSLSLAGDPTTRFSQNAFANMKNVNYLYIDDAYIGKYTNDELTYLGLPSNIKIVDDDCDAHSVFDSNVMGTVAVYIDDQKYIIINAKNISGKNLVFKDNVVKIENEAFMDNQNVFGSIHIPSTLTEIGVDAFAGCNFSDIVVDENNPVYQTVNLGAKGKVLMYKYDTWSNDSKVVAGLACGDIQLPSNLRSINDNAFKGCSEITTCDIPETVNFLGKDIFSDCSGISSITMHWNEDELNVLQTTDSNWLNECTNLKTISVPYGMTNIYRQYLQAMQVADNVQIIEQKEVKDNTVALILGLGLGIGVPIIVGSTILIWSQIHKKNKSK